MSTNGEQGKVVASITVSLDGYVTGPDDRPGQGLGVGGERLHYWVMGGPWAYETDHEPGAGMGEADREYYDLLLQGQSAGICGRGMYDSAGAFLKQPVRAAQAQADKAGTTLVFHDVAPDDYGVAVFHDANGNGRMDKNLMGTPTRPIAFSNNVQGRIGPPAFDAVKLAVQTAGLDTSVTLR